MRDYLPSVVIVTMLFVASCCLVQHVTPGTDAGSVAAVAFLLTLVAALPVTLVAGMATRLFQR